MEMSDKEKLTVDKLGKKIEGVDKAISRLLS